MSHNVTTSRFKRFCDTNSTEHVLDLPTASAAMITPPHLQPPLTDHNIPPQHHMANHDQSALKCCCGRPSCAYLEHNNAALGGLEHDLDMAAKMGQALLSRHESYLAESESERSRMSSIISTLESENSALQVTNEKIVAQNRDLLDQLEGLNTSLADSDAHVKNLEATLASAQIEVRRLIALARRTEELEGQLRDMEMERNLAKEEVSVREEEERSALSRWRQAEVRLRGMNREVERIESEARREREMHGDVMKRMERERELGVAAGRLKAVSATKGVDSNRGNSNVVSHFVRDILQDNANLQAGIVELRELLQTSNEEVQGLREQIVLHQPLSPSDSEVPGTVSSLEDQLGWNASKQTSQEVHVHHHYHAKFSSRKEKTPIARRNSKKRTSIGLLVSIPDSSIPSTPTTRPQRHFSSPNVPALSIDQPTAKGKRWSIQSAATGSTNLSSMPSSPRSYFEQRNQSIFDRLEEDAASSRPTSPESAGYASPKFKAGHRAGRPSEYSLAAFDEVSEDEGFNVGSDADADALPPDTTTEHQKSHIDQNDQPPAEPIILDTEQNIDVDGLPQPFDPDLYRTLRRTTSHESLVSISGMDIHLAKRKPSEIFLLTRGISPSMLKTPSHAKTISVAQPLAGIAEINASSSKRCLGGSDGDGSASLAMLSGLAAARGNGINVPREQPASGLGRLVGGWVRSGWGVAPMRSTGNLRARSRSGSASGGGSWGSRPMGINQKGAIPGLRPPGRAPSEVHARVLDQGGLEEALGE